MAGFNGLYLEVAGQATIDACRALYEGVLGLTVTTEEPGESLWFDAGDGFFGFHVGWGDLAAPAVRGAINVILKVDPGVSIDDEAVRLAAAGVDLVMQPEDMPWGQRVITFLDPAGHAVWYCQPLS